MIADSTSQLADPAPDHPMEVSPEPPPQINSPRSKRWIAYGFISFLGVVIVGFLLVAIGRIYLTQPLDRWSLRIAEILRLPAFKINGTSVRYRDYAKDLLAIRRLRQFEQGNNSGPRAELSDERLSDLVLLSLANNVLVAEAADQFKIKVEPADREAIINRLISTYGSRETAAAELEKRYGWTLPEWEERVMPYLILQQKLDERLASDPAPREALRARAAAVLKQIQAGKDFAELAREFGEDGTAAAGGDLGWFSRGEMVPQFEAAAFALKKGEVTAAPVESPFGYHLIKLEDRETKRGRSADGKPTTTERISARHILFRFASLDRYLDQALKAARLQFYLRLHNPFPG